ncbi:MAG TPA: hypothetical protein VF768_02825, partial [Holophagaceae bacterium]
MNSNMEFQSGVLEAYGDVYTPAALRALEALAPLEARRRELMAARLVRRKRRAEARERIGFLDPASLVPGTGIRVAD